MPLCGGAARRMTIEANNDCQTECHWNCPRQWEREPCGAGEHNAGQNQEGCCEGRGRGVDQDPRAPTQVLARRIGGQEEITQHDRPRSSWRRGWNHVRAPPRPLQHFGHRDAKFVTVLGWTRDQALSSPAKAAAPRSMRQAAKTKKIASSAKATAIAPPASNPELCIALPGIVPRPARMIQA